MFSSHIHKVRCPRAQNDCRVWKEGAIKKASGFSWLSMVISPLWRAMGWRKRGRKKNYCSISVIWSWVEGASSCWSWWWWWGGILGSSSCSTKSSCPGTNHGPSSCSRSRSRTSGDEQIWGPNSWTPNDPREWPSQSPSVAIEPPRDACCGQPMPSSAQQCACFSTSQ